MLIDALARVMHSAICRRRTNSIRF